jgi:ribosomal protein L31
MSWLSSSESDWSEEEEEESSFKFEAEVDKLDRDIDLNVVKKRHPAWTLGRKDNRALTGAYSCRPFYQHAQAPVGPDFDESCAATWRERKRGTSFVFFDLFDAEAHDSNERCPMNRSLCAWPGNVCLASRAVP